VRGTRLAGWLLCLADTAAQPTGAMKTLARRFAPALASDRTCGARRVWHDLLAEGVRCSLHRIDD
jgi:hypothetical protein